MEYAPNQDSPLYAPHRDMAYAGQDIVMSVFNRLDTATADASQRTTLAALGVTDKHVDAVVVCVAAATHLFFAGDRTITCIQDALDRSGWDRLDPMTRNLFLTYYGQEALQRWFLGVRDIAKKGSVAPTQSELSLLATRLSGRIDERYLPRSHRKQLVVFYEDLAAITQAMRFWAPPSNPNPLPDVIIRLDGIKRGLNTLSHAANRSTTRRRRRQQLLSYLRRPWYHRVRFLAWLLPRNKAC